jgi:NTE family protein
MKIIFTVFFIAGFQLISFCNYKNLALEGGGIRGIAYVGAIKALEEKQLLQNIENIAGTSVGAITAALLCVGYSAEELEKELSSIKFQKFNDGRGIFFGGFYRVSKKYGWYRGEKITDWINNLLHKKTGITNITFQQLFELSRKDKRYKNLYVTATNLSKQNWQTLNYKTFPQMRIADALRISASIPIYYTAIFMAEDGTLYNKPQKNVKTSIMADGGFLANYPIQLFDDTYEKSATLGLRLDNDNQIKNNDSSKYELAPYEINDFRDYIGAFYTLVLESLNRIELTEDDWKRSVFISTCNIGPKVKKLKKSEVEVLVTSGYTATLDYLSKLGQN